ncbi:hypothetical protein [Sphingomonas bacterium]|uniref:hypothetical protein n=1 Tax=Sphingomonas bacterium TaxID=1895847 RepID=UPI001575FF08|nr:hypothetical protein [Sphingomonas bacterium]
MRITSILAALAVLSLAASCVGPPPPSSVIAAPPVRVVAPPPPAIAAPALPADWRDWAQTPGDWRYERTTAGSRATFGRGDERAFAIECGIDRRVRLERPDLSGPDLSGGAFTVRTSSLTRVVAADRGGGPPDRARVTLSAGDPLLDAIGFSRGRFVVEQAGLPPLVLPAWAEVERVVEDCRA